MYRDRSLVIDLDIGKDAPPFGDAEDIQELLGNLLDNACKWARRRVSIALSGRDPVCIVVRDDGPGLADDDSARITRRGVRLDEAAAGHGLGLAIVDDIVAAYGGRLEFARDPEFGGLAVHVSLPGVTRGG